MQVYVGQQVSIYLAQKFLNGTLTAIDGWEASLLLEGTDAPIRVNLQDLYPYYAGDETVEAQFVDLGDNSVFQEHLERYELRQNLVVNLGVRYNLRATVSAHLGIAYRVLKEVPLWEDDFSSGDLSKWKLINGTAIFFTVASGTLAIAGTNNETIYVPDHLSTTGWRLHGLSFTLLSGAAVTLAAAIEGGFLWLTIDSTNWTLAYKTSQGILSTIATEAHGATFAANDIISVINDGYTLRLRQNGAQVAVLEDVVPGWLHSPWGFVNLNAAFSVDDAKVIGLAQQVTNNVKQRYAIRNDFYMPSAMDFSTLDAIRRNDTNYQPD